MRVMRTLTAFEPDTALVIGSFDGMHLGHAALLERARDRCSRVAMLSLWPHPSAVLSPSGSVALLQTLRQRWSCAQGMGVDDIAHVQFNSKVAAMSAEDFVDEMLRRRLSPSCVVVGEDFRFGAGRAGDVSMLSQRLASGQIGCEVVPHRLDESGHKLGSSAIRSHLANGELHAANRMLGRPYAIEGRVEHGAARGRTLGFRTANIVEMRQLWPAVGVYAASLVVLETPEHPRSAPMAAAANLGFRPTLHGRDDASASGTNTATGAATQPTLEVHVLDANLGEDLYGREVEVSLIERIRDEQRFASADELRVAIARDVERCRALLVPTTVAAAHSPALGQGELEFLREIASANHPLPRSGPSGHAAPPDSRTQRGSATLSPRDPSLADRPQSGGATGEDPR